MNKENIIIEFVKETMDGKEPSFLKLLNSLSLVDVARKDSYIIERMSEMLSDLLEEDIHFEGEIPMDIFIKYADEVISDASIFDFLYSDSNKEIISIMDKLSKTPSDYKIARFILENVYTSSSDFYPDTADGYNRMINDYYNNHSPYDDYCYNNEEEDNYDSWDDMTDLEKRQVDYDRFLEEDDYVDWECMGI